MKILLCAATEMEIAPTIQFLSQHTNDNIQILITGIGLMASTYALTKSISARSTQTIIQAGIAGTLNKNQQLGNVVVVENDTIGDAGVEEDSFHSLFDMKLTSANLFPWKNGMLCNEDDLITKAALPIVNAVTVNEISTDTDRINYYRHALKADIETMEGAALHYVGLMEKIPFLQIRSLSNFIGERDKTRWIMDKAIANLNLELQRILKILS